MMPEKDTFRMDLRNAKLCMELDCNTIFDAVMHRHCPTCSGSEFYPLEAWLNRDRTARPMRLDTRTAAIAALPRPAWLDRLYVRRDEAESDLAMAARPRSRAAEHRRAS